MAFQQLRKTKKKRKTNDVTENLNEEDVNDHIQTNTLQKKIKLVNT